MKTTITKTFVIFIDFSKKRTSLIFYVEYIRHSDAFAYISIEDVINQTIKYSTHKRQITCRLTLDDSGRDIKRTSIES